MAQQEILPPITEDDRMLSGLVYPLWPLVAPIVLFSSKRTEPYLHYNALQALALGGVSTGGALLVFLLTWFCMWLMPGSFITFSAIMGIGLFTLVVFIIIFYLTLVLFIAWRVANGKFLRLPFLGTWAEKRMQRNLNITPESYSTAILGERRPKAPLTPFDYRQAPGYVEEEEPPLYQEDESENFYNPDTDTYEYTSEATSAADLLSYEQANAPAPAAQPAAPKPAAPAARPQGFQAKAPLASGASPATAPAPAPASDGFKPLSSTFGSKLPPGGSGKFGPSAGGNSSGFKPFTPAGDKRNASAPVVAGQRPQSGQFKPMLPKTEHPAASSGGQFKPLVTKEERPAPAPGEFRPGLGTKPRPSNPPAAPRFKWDSLDNK